GAVLPEESTNQDTLRSLAGGFPWILVDAAEDPWATPLLPLRRRQADREGPGERRVAADERDVRREAAAAGQLGDPAEQERRDVLALDAGPVGIRERPVEAPVHLGCRYRRGLRR